MILPLIFNVNLLRYHCFWCKHPFESTPIGCPIRYISSEAIKTYFSQISRDTYTIKERITKENRIKLQDKAVENININIGEYYETDGVFCSFNCCKSFVDGHKHDRKYDSSNMLLTKMYNNMAGTKNIIIAPAPHWRTLEHYGGHLNIVQFRDSFNKIDYDCHGNIKTQLPKFLPVGTIYEEKIKF